jgi:cytosine/adenosine deaminase-related metal-dependent hydrolase
LKTQTIAHYLRAAAGKQKPPALREGQMAEWDTAKITRRRAITGISASALAASLSVGQSAAAIGDSAAAPASTEFVIRGGYVLPVDPAMTDLPKGDVHVRDGKIVAVAETVDAPGADIIDATRMVVMPGFVDTHWHMWNGIWKGLANGPAEYFQLHRLAPQYTVEDHYVAVQYAAIEAINAGVTTCHNWAHGVRNFDDVQAEMQALVDAGIRAKMGYMGVIQGNPTTRADFQRALDWIAANGKGRIGLGLLLDEGGAHSEDLVKTARDLGLRPITNHGGFMATPQLIGPEFIFTHGANMRPALAGAIAALKVNVALCPGTDPMIGNGLPPILTLLSAGVPLENIAFSVDVTAQSPADPFAALRTMVNAARMQQVAAEGLAGDLLGIVKAAPQWKFSYRDAITSGTLSGANVLGLGDQTGSLTPGKRADIILVRTGDANMLPAGNVNPTYELLQNGEPSNVDTVIIDGIVRKRSGKLIDIDVGATVAKAAESVTALRQRAGMPPLDTNL